MSNLDKIADEYLPKRHLIDYYKKTRAGLIARIAELDKKIERAEAIEVTSEEDEAWKEMERK